MTLTMTSSYVETMRVPLISDGTKQLILEVDGISFEYEMEDDDDIKFGVVEFEAAIMVVTFIISGPNRVRPPEILNYWDAGDDDLKTKAELKHLPKYLQDSVLKALEDNIAINDLSQQV